MACPFCGNGFDIMDFHREEIMLQAEECLARGAYEPAREKFQKVLESDPEDIKAYRGLILCACKIQSTEDLKERYDQVSSDIDAIKEIVSSAKEHVAKEDADYLDKLVSLFEIPKAYNNIEGRKTATVKLEKKRNIQEEVQDKRDGCLTPIIVLSVALLIGSVAICFSDLDDPFLTIRNILIALLFDGCVIGATVFLSRKLQVKNIVRIPESSKSLSDKLGYCEAKYSEILSEVLEYEASFMEKPEEKVIPREDKKREPDTVITGSVICAKCGGMLKLNAAQELYECNSCGVSYGKYLFFGDLTSNAVKAMDMGEYDEADQIFSHKLTMDPKDFGAVLGRFLCAGRWKSLEDIDINDNMFMSHVRDLPDKLNAVGKRISEEDQPLWKDIRMLSDLLTEYSVRRHAFNRVNEKYKSVSGKLNNTFLMPEEITDYKHQENELWEQVTELEGECRETGARISEVIKVLTEAGH